VSGIRSGRWKPYREVLLIALGCALPWHAEAQKGDEAQLKTAVEGAKDVRKLSKPLAADAQARVEKALGMKLDKADLPPKLFTIPVGRDPFTACVTAVPGPKGPVRLAVVVGKDHRGLQSIQRVVLLSHKEDKAVEGEAFLGQFLERTATANAWNPPSALDEAAKKDDPEVRRLLEFLRQMFRNHERYEALSAKLPKKDAGAGEDAKSLAGLFEGLRGQADGFGALLKPDEGALFERYAREGQESAKRVESALAKKDFVAAQAALDEMGCAKCHGSFRKAFQTRRQALQIGDGYFKVGHDVLPAKPGAEESSQAVATGVKKGLLILDRVTE
jgi:hypothetical protein